MLSAFLKICFWLSDDEYKSFSAIHYLGPNLFHFLRALVTEQVNSASSGKFKLTEII